MPPPTDRGRYCHRCQRPPQVPLHPSPRQQGHRRFCSPAQRVHYYRQCHADRRYGSRRLSRPRGSGGTGCHHHRLSGGDTIVDVTGHSGTGVGALSSPQQQGHRPLSPPAQRGQPNRQCCRPPQVPTLMFVSSPRKWGCRRFPADTAETTLPSVLLATPRPDVAAPIITVVVEAPALVPVPADSAVGARYHRCHRSPHVQKSPFSCPWRREHLASSPPKQREEHSHRHHRPRQANRSRLSRCRGS